LHSQNQGSTKTPDAQPARSTHKFSVGASVVSGYGLGYNLAVTDKFNILIVGFGIASNLGGELGTSDFSSSIGGELQYNLTSNSKSRLYLLAGATNIASDGDYWRRHRRNFGGGAGYEVFFTDTFGINFSCGFARTDHGDDSTRPDGRPNYEVVSTGTNIAAGFHLVWSL
jgi:hypothetical protein